MRDGATTESSDRIVFQMEVEPQAEPISGLLRRGEHEHPFVGWVALAGALERILELTGSDPTHSNTTQSGRKSPK